MLHRLQAVFQVAGTGVSPFNTTKQAVLLIAVASVMTTVTQDQIGIILVEDATSLARRKLLQVDDELEMDDEQVRPTAFSCESLACSGSRGARCTLGLTRYVSQGPAH